MAEQKLQWTIREAWESFDKATIPVDAGPVHRIETRRAFYGGAWALLCYVKQIGEECSANMTEEEGEAILEAIDREILAFYEDVNDGMA